MQQAGSHSAGYSIWGAGVGCEELTICTVPYIQGECMWLFVKFERDTHKDNLKPEPTTN